MKRFCHQCGTQALTPALFCQSCSAPAYYPPPAPVREKRPPRQTPHWAKAATCAALLLLAVSVIASVASYRRDPKTARDIFGPNYRARDAGRQRLEATAEMICRSLHRKAGLSAATCGVSGEATLVIMHPRASGQLAAASLGAPGFYDAAERAGFRRVSFSDGAGHFTNYDLTAGAFER